MWFLLLSTALAGPADDLAGAWRLDVSRSDATERALAALAPMGKPPPGGGGKGPPGGGMGGGPPGGGMGGGPPGGGMGGGPPGGGMDGGPPGGGMGGPPGGAPDGDGSGRPPEGPALLAGLLLGGTFGLQVSPTDDGLTVAWGPTPPVTLVVGGPAAKVTTPAGVMRVRARMTEFGVALERKAKGAILTETLFRQGDTLIVVAEASTGSDEVIFLRRVYVPAPAAPAASPAPAEPAASGG